MILFIHGLNFSFKMLLRVSKKKIFESFPGRSFLVCCRLTVHRSVVVSKASPALKNPAPNRTFMQRCLSWFSEICTPKKKTTRKKHRQKNDPLAKCPLVKLPLEKSSLTKTSFSYQCMIVVWHMKMVVQWVSEKFPDGECAPAIFLPYMLIIIFNKPLFKHSLRCSSKLFFRS